MPLQVNCIIFSSADCGMVEWKVVTRNPVKEKFQPIVRPSSKKSATNLRSEELQIANFFVHKHNESVAAGRELTPTDLDTAFENIVQQSLFYQIDVEGIRRAICLTICRVMWQTKSRCISAPRKEAHTNTINIVEKR